MVQLLLTGSRRARLLQTLVLISTFLSGLVSPLIAASKPKPSAAVTVPVLQLEGGRKLVYDGTLLSEREFATNRGFWKRVVDVVAGPPEFHYLVRPYAVVTDSRGRVIVTDPGAMGIHIFDVAQRKYKFISRSDAKEALRSPQCVAVDKQDNIYVTDSNAGKIFVFDADGKFRQVIGSLKGGEGYFKRPTGIAVDSEAHRIYVSDTLRDKVYVMDMQGSVLGTIGKSGSGDGEFNFPTELRLEGPNLIVVDAMNFRIQVLDRSGTFQYAVGHAGDGRGDLFRPKGVGVDSEGHLYVVDGLYNIVQVFDRQGTLLYYFGQKTSGFGDLQMPSGLFIDHSDRVWVVDSFNHRVEVFQYFGVNKQASGGWQ